MMYWHNGGMSGWGWFGMSLGMLLFTALLVIGGVLLFRALDRSTTHPAPPAPPTAPGPTPPEQLLAERFALGEIDEQEYRERLAALRGMRGTGDDDRDPFSKRDGHHDRPVPR